jgi:hypothetical protein
VLLNAIQLLDQSLPAARQSPDPTSALEILLGKVQLTLERGLLPPPEILPETVPGKSGGLFGTLLPHPKPHPKPIDEASS